MHYGTLSAETRAGDKGNVPRGVARGNEDDGDDGRADSDVSRGASCIFWAMQSCARKASDDAPPHKDIRVAAEQHATQVRRTSRADASNRMLYHWHIVSVVSDYV